MVYGMSGWVSTSQVSMPKCVKTNIFAIEAWYGKFQNCLMLSVQPMETVIINILAEWMVCLFINYWKCDEWILWNLS